MIGVSNACNRHERKPCKNKKADHILIYSFLEAVVSSGGPQDCGIRLQLQPQCPAKMPLNDISLNSRNERKTKKDSILQMMTENGRQK